MAESRTGLLQGTLDLLILRALSLGEHHGLGVARPHSIRPAGADHHASIRLTAGVSVIHVLRNSFAARRLLAFC